MYFVWVLWEAMLAAAITVGVCVWVGVNVCVWVWVWIQYVHCTMLFNYHHLHHNIRKPRVMCSVSFIDCTVKFHLCLVIHIGMHGHSN